MQRVLYLEHNTDGTIGGSHFCLLEICRSLDKSRYQPVVWFFENNALLDEFRATGAEVVVQPPPARFLFRKSGIKPLAIAQQIAQSAGNAFQTLVANVWRWRRVLRQRRIDIVHINNSCDTDNDLMLAARALGIPCVAHQRGFPTRLQRTAQSVASRLDSIVAISSSVRDSLLRQGLPGDRIILIHDGIDPERIRAQAGAKPGNAGGLREQYGIAADAPLIGMVGNVKEWKGQEVLVRAMRDVIATHPQAHCFFVGAVADPVYMAKMQTLMNAFGLTRNITFLGYQRQPPTLMAQMDVIVHASIEAEPFGIVILEAMSLAKPVIASNLGGPMDIVVDGVTGFLTEAGDAAALSARIRELIADRARAAALAQAGYERMLGHFTSQANIAHLHALYAKLSAPKPV